MNPDEYIEKDRIIIDHLLELFPEYKSSPEWNEGCDQELAYMAYGCFVDYLVRKLNSIEKPEQDEFISKSYKHFDDLINSKDEYVSTLGVTQVVEQLSQEWDTLKLMKKLFSKRALEWVDKSLKHTGLVRSVSEIPN